MAKRLRCLWHRGRLAPGPRWGMELLMSAIVNIPAQFNNLTMYEFFSQVFDKNADFLDEEYIFDFAALEFIWPSGVTALANTTKLLLEENIKIFYKDHRDNKNAVKFLDRNGFFEYFVGEKNDPAIERKLTTFPLSFVSLSTRWSFYDNYFTPWIDYVLGVDTKKNFSALNVCLDELFNNIQDHSTRSLGCMFAQHYPQNRNVIIAISDFGIGIANNVRKIKNVEKDSEAISLAITEGFSTKSTPRNRGAGLNTVIRQIAETHKGRVSIYSWRGQLDMDEDKIKLSDVGFDCAPYPGTMVALTLSLDKIKIMDEIDNEEEFSW